MLTIWLLIRLAAKVAEKADLSEDYIIYGPIADLWED